jgi:LPXTG-motif cell wall-anchored protein
MRRVATIVSVLAVAPLIALAPTVPAYAGLAEASIAITHSPAQFTLDQTGAFTVTLSYNNQFTLPNSDYDVIDQVPASMTVTSVDPGGFSCSFDNTAHTVECLVTSTLSTDEAFTIHVTPSQVGHFTDSASYTFELNNPPPSSDARHAAAVPALQGPTATDDVDVVAPATPTPTPTPTHTVTPTSPPTHRPTNPSTPTSSATVQATKSARPVATPSLPNTGGDDLAQLVAIGALLICAGGMALVTTRRRRG